MGILKQAGCQVTGTWARVGGQPSGAAITVSPARGGVWAGQVFTRESIAVDVDADGRFRTPPLPPSTVVGPYIFSGGGVSVEVNIPTGIATASLEDLLAASEEEPDGDNNA